LKDHGDAAGARRQVVDDVAADYDVPRGLRFQTGDYSQKGGLATARRPKQHHEFAVRHREADAIDGCNLRKVLGYLVG
jgi:hypothetical protein